MIVFGIITGIYSYILFFLGITGHLSRETGVIISCLYGLFLICYSLFLIAGVRISLKWVGGLWHDKLLLLFALLLFVMIGINLLGAFVPELAFDALWYHLTLPKLYLLTHKIVFIPGGLLYYSAMPKLAEVMYAGVLSFGDEIWVKSFHFMFGVSILFLIFKLARFFVPRRLSLLACIIFYANLVVAWESTVAYTDLFLTFFATMSLYLILRFLNEGGRRNLYLAGVFIGLAISVKLIALAFLALLVIVAVAKRKELHNFFDFAGPVLLALLIPLPWFLFSYMHTGNPLYPFFTQLYPTSSQLFSKENLIGSLSQFLFSADPISPLYLICVPLIIAFRNLFSKNERNLLLIAFVSLLIWLFTPKSGGGRFLMVYLPLFSVVIATLVWKLQQKNLRAFSRLIIIAALFTMIVSTGYRGAAEIRYFPVLSGQESKENFLSQHLHFSFGDFYDTDNFFARTMAKGDTVLLEGFHNLYYVDFPFIDQSWVEKGDRFTYIAVQNSSLPVRFSTMKKVYENPQTHVVVYGEEGKIWTY